MSLRGEAALATGSLKQVSAEVLSFKLKTPWSDGTTAILLSPMELIEKLSALVPPPRKNIVHYHGVLAPHAKDRDRIVPARKNTDDKAGEEGEGPPHIDETPPHLGSADGPSIPSRC
jgi:hypothetical protein